VKRQIAKEKRNAVNSLKYIEKQAKYNKVRIHHDELAGAANKAKIQILNNKKKRQSQAAKYAA
jgi:hypothetical protein